MDGANLSLAPASLAVIKDRLVGWLIGKLDNHYYYAAVKETPLGYCLAWAAKSSNPSVNSKVAAR